MAKVKTAQHALGLKLAFHGVGLSCLAGAVFLELLVFLGISTQGAFVGIEQSPLILNVELACSVFCVFYLGYLAVGKVRSLLRSKSA
jgi:hypothetical protein